MTKKALIRSESEELALFQQVHDKDRDGGHAGDKGRKMRGLLGGRGEVGAAEIETLMEASSSLTPLLPLAAEQAVGRERQGG